MSILYARIDVAILRDPKLVKCGPLPRLLYFQIILYCRENLTDGVVEKTLLSYVATDIPKAKLQVSKLVEVGLLEEADAYWRIPIDKWRKWNPLKEEVEAKRAEEAQRKADYRSRKSEGVPTGQVRTEKARDAQPKPKPEEEPKPYMKDPPNNLESDGDQRVGEILNRYATIAADQAKNVTDRNAYMAKARETARARADLYRWLDLFPTAPADAIAGWLHGDKGSMGYYPRADELAPVVELRPA